jgi:hypothetical protein
MKSWKLWPREIPLMKLKHLNANEAEWYFSKVCYTFEGRKGAYWRIVFTKRVSKNSREYQNRNTVENDALRLLENEGKYLKAGEILRCITTNYYSRRRRNNRAIPLNCLTIIIDMIQKGHGIACWNMQFSYGTFWSYTFCKRYYYKWTNISSLT